MEITEVRIKLTEEPEDRLRAFCSITFDDCFVIRDLKIIDGPNGPFVAMPSRKLTAHCPQCAWKNPLRASFCNQCGIALKEEGEGRSGDSSPTKIYADIAHPINAECREMIQRQVLREYAAERHRSKEPGYAPRYDSDYSGEVCHTDSPERSIRGPSGMNLRRQERAHSGDEDFGAGIF